MTVVLPLMEAMLPAAARAQTAGKPRLIVNVWPNGLPMIAAGYSKVTVDEFLKADPAVVRASTIIARTHRNYANDPNFVGGHQGCQLGMGTAGPLNYKAWSASS